MYSMEIYQPLRLMLQRSTSSCFRTQLRARLFTTPRVFSPQTKYSTSSIPKLLLLQTFSSQSSCPPYTLTRHLSSTTSSRGPHPPLIHPSTLSTEQYHALADTYINSLLSVLDEVQEANESVDVEYSVRHFPLIPPSPSPTPPFLSSFYPATSYQRRLY